MGERARAAVRRGVRRRRRRPRAWLPWLVLALMATTSYAADTRWDVEDTHDRLDRIYEDLGIAPDEDQGCAAGCSQPRKQCRPPSSGGKGRPEGKAGEGGAGEGAGGGDEGTPGGGSSGPGEGEGATEPECAVAPTRAPSLPAWLGYAIIVAILLAMLIPLGLALRNSYQGTADEGGPPPPELDEDADAPDVRPGPWVVDLSDCRRLAAEGQVEAAFAALHRAMLLGLERSRHLSLDETTTNWEYVRRLASRPELRQVLAAVTEAAERSVLGRRPPSAAQFDELVTLVSQHTREARR